MGRGEMLAALATPAPAQAPATVGLGDRFIRTDGAASELVQVLRIRDLLAQAPGFELALRERVARLTNVRNSAYARMFRVERVEPPASTLVLVSEHVEGVRLSDLVRIASEREVDIDISTTISTIRQLVSNTAMLHEHAADIANGVIGPERLIVTPRGRIVIQDYALAAAVSMLRYSPPRLWTELRVAVCPDGWTGRFTHRDDVLAIGLVGLSLVLGRPLQDHEFPNRLPALLESARERSAFGHERRLSDPLRGWFARALQLEGTGSFASAPEAWVAFEQIVAGDPVYTGTPIALEMFLYSCTAALIQPPSAQPRTSAAAAPIPERAREDTTAPPAAARDLSTARPAAIPDRPRVNAPAPATVAPAGVAPARPAPVAGHVPANTPGQPAAAQDCSAATRPAARADRVREIGSKPPATAREQAAPPRPEPIAERARANDPAELAPTPEPSVSSRPANPPAEPSDVAAFPVGVAASPSRHAVPGEIDWSVVVAPTAVVATARDIADLLSTSDDSGPEEDLTPADPTLPAAFSPEDADRGLELPSDGMLQAGHKDRLRVQSWHLPASGSGSWTWRRVAVAGLVVAILGGGVVVTRLVQPAVAAVSDNATLIVESSPAGLQVLVDGSERGVTPARLSLPAGEHTVEVRGQGTARVVPITVATGAEITQYFDFSSGAQSTPLAVTSPLAGRTVPPDAVAKGTTLAAPADPAPGDREGVRQAVAGSSRHTATDAPVATSASGPPTHGWLSVQAPFPVEVHLGTRVFTPAGQRIRIAEGRHEIAFVNKAQGLREVRVVHVVAGKVSDVVLTPPATGSVNINASPWAEVWIGQRRVGETPLANLAVPAGRHEVVLRHPELGEKREAISVTPGSPVRLSVDMR